MEMKLVAVYKLIVTKWFWRTFAASTTAYIVAFLPFLASYIYHVHKSHADPVHAFAESSEHLFVGGLACSLAAYLNYYEYEKEVDFNIGVGGFAYFSFISAIVCCFYLFICIFNIYDAHGFRLTEDYRNDALRVTALSLISAIITVIQVRRARDRKES